MAVELEAVARELAVVLRELPPEWWQQPSDNVLDDIDRHEAIRETGTKLATAMQRAGRECRRIAPDNDRFALGMGVAFRALAISSLPPAPAVHPGEARCPHCQSALAALREHAQRGQQETVQRWAQLVEAASALLTMLPGPAAIGAGEHLCNLEYRLTGNCDATGAFLDSIGLGHVGK
jgi:hypothetical protein